MRTFNAMNHIAELNKFKKQTEGLPLSEEDLRNGFKACGIPSNSLFFLEFKRYGFLTKVERTLYVWNNTSPILYIALQNVYSKYQKRVNKYAHDNYERKKRNKILKSKEIEAAINLLKDNGFEIFAPYQKLFVKLLV